MFFNSWTYACFFLLVLSLYYVLSRRAQNWMLLAASYFFYAWWDWRFVGLLWVSTVVDYIVSNRIHPLEQGNPKRKRLLLVSIITNLGILGFFKYFNFFTGSCSTLLERIGIPCDPLLLKIILPVGISFYTFQSLGYTIDVYRNKIKPEKSLPVFALYVAFFPQLVAGPIERASHILPILRARRTVKYNQFISGIVLILTGLVRKIVLADALSGFVNAAFKNPDSHSSFRLLIAAYGFALVIYNDFAGYTDIARGSARLLGIELMVNFKRPYFATNITEFWRRWHISLSTWLRDYLYIPLGGNRGSKLMTCRNIMLTMLLGGLWHGAQWNFVIWGGIHGIFLSAHKLWTDKTRQLTESISLLTQWLTIAAGIFLTFNTVCFAWIFFRANNISTAMLYIKNILVWRTGGFNLALIEIHKLLVVAGILIFIDLTKGLLERKKRCFSSIHPLLQSCAIAFLMICLLVLGDRVYEPFIYFQF